MCARYVVRVDLEMCFSPCRGQGGYDPSGAGRTRILSTSHDLAARNLTFETSRYQTSRHQHSLCLACYWRAGNGRWGFFDPSLARMPWPSKGEEGARGRLPYIFATDCCLLSSPRHSPVRNSALNGRCDYGGSRDTELKTQRFAYVLVRRLLSRISAGIGSIHRKQYVQLGGVYSRPPCEFCARFGIGSSTVGLMDEIEYTPPC